MTFTDTLGFQLFTLAMVAGVLFYSGLIGYITYRRYGPGRTYEHLRGTAVPLGMLGVVVTSVGMWGEITWPLPGSYNILFFDPYVLLGVVLLGFSLSVVTRFKTQYIGLMAAMTGALSIYYGYSAYILNMTKEPMTMLFLYVALGGTAILTFPITVFIDRMVLAPLTSPSAAPSATEASAPVSGSIFPTISIRAMADVDPPVTLPWKLVFTGFSLFLLFAVGSAILAIIIGGGAIPAHLASAP